MQESKYKRLFMHVRMYTILPYLGLQILFMQFTGHKAKAIDFGLYLIYDLYGWCIMYTKCMLLYHS